MRDTYRKPTSVITNISTDHLLVHHSVNWQKTGVGLDTEENSLVNGEIFGHEQGSGNISGDSKANPWNEDEE